MSFGGFRMKIRSLSVIRFAKDIPFVKKRYNSKSPLDFETFFIEKSKTSGVTYHGLVGEYKGKNIKALMKCSVISHGYFTVTKGNFNQGRGCPECGLLRRANKKRHDDEYAIREIEKECNRRGDVRFICFVDGYQGNTVRNLKYLCLNGHGEMFTSYEKFMAGCGCPECGKRKIGHANRTNELVAIDNAKKECDRRGDMKFICFVDGYKNAHEYNLKYLCLNGHGEKIISYDGLMHGCGCGECAIERRADSTRLKEEDALLNVMKECEKRGNCGNPVFIDGYKRNNVKNLQLDCFCCGTKFITRYGNFMYGKGCSNCNESGFKKNKPGYVYIQRITGKINAGKIGITNKTPQERLKQHKRLSKLNHEIIFSCYIEDGNRVWEIEKMIKTILKDKMRFVPRELMPDGYTETFPIELLTPILNEVKSVCLK